MSFTVSTSLSPSLRQLRSCIPQFPSDRRDKLTCVSSAPGWTKVITICRLFNVIRLRNDLWLSENAILVIATSEDDDSQHAIEGVDTRCSTQYSMDTHRSQ